MNKQQYQVIIALLFVLSGSTGIIYQIVWFKYLSLFLGNTTYAQTIVLATFMGGLAIGSALWGRRSDSIKRPLLLYAILELGIAGYCFFFPEILNVVKEVFFGAVAFAGVEIGSASLVLFKLLTSVLMLIVPTIFMGGTLPVLVRGITRTIEESGKSVAILYFLNSFGAVVGSLLGGFFLIRLIGLQSTIAGTAVVNAGIGIVALLLSAKDPDLLRGHSVSQSAQPDGEFTRKQIIIAVVVAGISGISSMIYEVSWVRMLTPVFGSSTYSFSLMLVAFISGITLGSLIVSQRTGAIKNTFGFLATCQFGVVIAMLVSLPLYERIPYLFWKLSALIVKTDATYPLYLSFQFFFCFFMMFVPTIFLGMTLPVASRIASRSIQTLGRSVGNVFSVNTVGAVAGSLAAGLLLIPAFGIQHTVEIAILINVAAVLVVLFEDRQEAAVRKVVMAVLIAASFAGYSLLAGNWSQLMFHSGVFRKLVRQNAPPPKNFQEFVSKTNQNATLYYKEGASATVSVTRSVSSEGVQNILTINGKPDASSLGDMPTQVLLGQLPMLLHPHPDSVMLVGLGSGMTAGSILTHDVRSVDCVEISPEVVEASRYFEEVNNKPLEDKRFHLFIEDAQAFLDLRNRKYDVIISEPSNPWIAGVGNLYSVNFFRKCKAALNHDGLMLQWFHLYEMDNEILKLVLRTFLSEFPHVALWTSFRYDILLVGSKNPIEPDLEIMRKKISSEKVSRDLARIHVDRLPTFLSLQSMSQKGATMYAGHGVVNSEDRPYLEYDAPRAFFTSKGVGEYGLQDERRRIRSEQLLLSAYQKKYPLSVDDKLSIARLHSHPEKGEHFLAYSLLSELHQKYPANDSIARQLAFIAGQLNKSDEQGELLKELARRKPDDVHALSQYAWQKFLQERTASSFLSAASTAESERLLDRCIVLSKDTVAQYHIQLGEIFLETQRFDKSIIHFKRGMELQRKMKRRSFRQEVNLLLKISEANYSNGNMTEALQFALDASVADPENEEIRDYLYNVLQDNMRK